MTRREPKRQEENENLNKAWEAEAGEISDAEERISVVSFLRPQAWVAKSRGKEDLLHGPHGSFLAYAENTFLGPDEG